METTIKLFTILCLFISFVSMPLFSKKDIYYGIRISNLESRELKKINREYVISNIILAIIIAYFFLASKDPIIGILISTFAYIFLFTVIYVRANKKVKLLKAGKTSDSLSIKKTPVTIIDTNFSKDRERHINVSAWYFVIPLSIVMVTIIATLVYYDRIPDMIPMHYNMAGKVDRWANKSYGSVFLLPMSSLAMTGLFYFVYLIIGKSKQQISAKTPLTSAKQNRIYRKIWSFYSIISATLMNILFSYMHLSLFRNSYDNSNKIMLATLAITFIMVISTMIIGLYVGNGGSKLKIKDETEIELEVDDSDDDRYWKWGSIYYNPNDPSVFVEKRMGIGWTINMATTKGKAYLIGILVFTAITILISIFIK